MRPRGARAARPAAARPSGAGRSRRVVRRRQRRTSTPRRPTQRARGGRGARCRRCSSRVRAGDAARARGRAHHRRRPWRCIDAARSARRDARRAASWPALLVVLATMLAFFLHRYARYHQREFRKLRAPARAARADAAVDAAAVARRCCGSPGRSSTISRRRSTISASYSYLVPLGAGAILVALLANGRIATVYAAFAALLFGGARRAGTRYLHRVGACSCSAPGSTRSRPTASARRCCAPGSSSAAWVPLAALALEALRGRAAASGPRALRRGAGLRRRGGRRRAADLVQPAAARAAVQRPDRHPAARAVERQQPAAVGAGGQGSRLLQPQPGRRHAGRGGGARRSAPTRCSAAWPPSTTTSAR